MPEMFGKRYDWTKVNGVWSLEKGLEPLGPVEATPLTYDEFLDALRKIEEEPYCVNGPVYPEMREELIRYAGGEGEGRISLGSDGEGVSDPEAGGEAGRSDRGVKEQRDSSLAREEGLSE